ncbi:hypothetical protein ABPG75_009968 [Micractinium tetrahymenae]
MLSSLGRSTSESRVRKSGSLTGRMDKLGSLAEPLEDAKPGAAPAPGWAELARQHLGQYAFLAGTCVLLAFSEGWEPFHRNFYVGSTSDMEYWRYSFPLKRNHVPAWAVPCVAVFSTLLVILAFLAAGRISRAEAHHACLLAVSCVAATGLLTNWIKVNIGRPRPHFVHRCWPNGLRPVFSKDGTPICADGAVDVFEGIKSFPSGHTSWATSGLGFLTFWLLGKLRVFADGAAAPERFALAMAPLLGAAWIGMSRIQDYWHHVEDVCAGFMLGLLMAFCYYRQIYAGMLGPHAGMLTAAVRGSSGGSTGSVSRGALSSGPSKYGLYGGAAGEEPPAPLPLYADDRV